MRLPLVDGHGNFGSLATTTAGRHALHRGPDVRPRAMLMVESIDEDTVDFAPNYDGQEQEPAVLPAAYPNLLVNGSSGIAVGMATNMPPHNLGEVIAAARHLIRYPNADLDALMRHVPGPDLPTGGRIVGLSGIRDAYETGRGTFKIRATVAVEDVTPAPQGHGRHRTAVHRRARRRSSPRSRTWSARRSSRASPTSRTSPTASTACGWSSRSRTASTPRPSSSSSTS